MAFLSASAENLNETAKFAYTETMEGYGYIFMDDTLPAGTANVHCPSERAHLIVLAESLTTSEYAIE